MTDRFLERRLHRDDGTVNEFHYESTTPATRILEKRKELIDVQAALDQQKEEFEGRMQKVNDYTLDLKKKQGYLLRFRSRVDDFAITTADDLKKYTALEEQYLDAKEAITEQIADLHQRTQYLRKVLADKERRRERLSKYKAFLESLMNQEMHETRLDRFDVIDSILDRKEILTHLHSHMSDGRERHDSLEQGKYRALVARKKELTKRRMERTLEKGRKQQELEALRKEAEVRSRNYVQATDEVRGTLASIGLVELATDNLYRKVLAVRETYASQARVPPNASTMDKLNDIQRFYVAFRTIAQDNARSDPNAPPEFLLFLAGGRTAVEAANESRDPAVETSNIGLNVSGVSAAGSVGGSTAAGADGSPRTDGRPSRRSRRRGRGVAFVPESGGAGASPPARATRRGSMQGPGSGVGGSAGGRRNGPGRGGLTGSWRRERRTARPGRRSASPALPGSLATGATATAQRPPRRAMPTEIRKVDLSSQVEAETADHKKRRRRRRRRSASGLNRSR